MYRKVNYKKSTIKSIEVFEAERIEEKVKRIVNNKEPITDGAPLNYTEKGELNPNYDHRTDRWEYATENMSVVHKNESAKNSNNPNVNNDESSNIDNVPNNVSNDNN